MRVSAYKVTVSCTRQAVAHESNRVLRQEAGTIRLKCTRQAAGSERFRGGKAEEDRQRVSAKRRWHTYGVVFREHTALEATMANHSKRLLVLGVELCVNKGALHQ